MEGLFMKPDPVYQRWCELSWRRPLTAPEQVELRAWLIAHPEAQAEAEAEMALNQTLARLPDAPVPSNFTARLWQTIERDEATKVRAAAPRRTWWWRVLVPRFAVATVVVGSGLLAYRHNESVQQVEFAKSFLAEAGATSLADPKVIEDFEVICQLSPPTAADEELIKLME
jgi:anti-sigma factor RsiW